MHITQYVPENVDGLILTTLDMNNDGNIDTWIYRDENEIIQKAIMDKTRNGHPDSWELFKNGRAYFSQEDHDGDGRVDVLFSHVFDEEYHKYRGFSFTLQNKKRNIFSEQEDTGWIELHDAD